MGIIAKTGCLAYMLLLSTMLLHPDPWSLFGSLRGELVQMARWNLLHGAVFFVLGLVTEMARRPMSRTLALTCGLIYASVIELIQPLAGRVFQWADLAQNIVGLLSGTLLAALIVSGIHSRNISSPQRKAESPDRHDPTA